MWVWNREIEAGGVLCLPQHQIDHPAAANVFTRLPAMEQYIRVCTANFFEGIRKDRQSVEGTILVDVRSDGLDGGSQPCGIGDDRPEGVAEDTVAQPTTGPVWAVQGECDP